MPPTNSVNFMTVYDLTLPSTLGSEVACQGGVNVNQMTVPVVNGQAYAVQILAQAGDLGDLLTLEFETMGTLTGTVTDDKAPANALGGISVNALSTNATAPYGGAITAADGTWTMRVPTRDMIVKFTDGGGVYATEFYDNAVVKFDATHLTVAEGITTPNIDAALTDAGSMSGTITSSSGAPLANATVQLYESPTPGAPFRSATTLADGTYSIQGVVAGDYFVRFSEANHLTEWYNNVPNWSPTLPTITITAGANFPLDETLTQGGTISGVVTDDLGTPLGDVRVTLYSAEGVVSKVFLTDVDGAYAFQALPAGTYAVDADSDASPPASSVITHRSGGTVWHHRPRTWTSARSPSRRVRTMSRTSH